MQELLQVAVKKQKAGLGKIWPKHLVNEHKNFPCKTGSYFYLNKVAHSTNRPHIKKLQVNFVQTPNLKNVLI